MMSELFIDKEEINPTAESIVYEINKFDDGNQKYEQMCENKWYIYSNWHGKCALVNCANPTIKISSISLWKISKLVIL